MAKILSERDLSPKEMEAYLKQTYEILHMFCYWLHFFIIAEPVKTRYLTTVVIMIYSMLLPVRAEDVVKITQTFDNIAM